MTPSNHSSHWVLCLTVAVSLGALCLTVPTAWPPVLLAHGQGNAVAVVSAASFTQPVAPESIVAAFGVNLATRVEAAASQPLPTQLAGTTVRVNGQLAPLFFVSPNQINCLVPAGTPSGAVSVVVTSGDGTISQGTVRIATAAPSLFTANASGLGVPAAVALRVKSDGTQTTEAISRFDQAQNRFVTVPISLGPEGEQVFLILFGTGIRGRERLADVSALIGGANVPVLFAEAQSDFAGLDQINVGPLPRALLGRGRINRVQFSKVGRNPTNGRLLLANSSEWSRTIGKLVF